MVVVPLLRTVMLYVRMVPAVAGSGPSVLFKVMFCPASEGAAGVSSELYAVHALTLKTNAPEA